MAYVQKPGRGSSAKTGNGIPSALLQTREEIERRVNSMISRKKKSDSIADAEKSLKTRKAAERTRDVLERGIRYEQTEKKAVSDSTTVANKLQKAGIDGGKMGMEMANLTRKEGNPYDYTGKVIQAVKQADGKIKKMWVKQ
jgi:hypothetical protein